MMDTFSGMKSVHRRWTAVIAVGLATFSVVTTEMLPVGLLTSIAETLSITTGSAGLMISCQHYWQRYSPRSWSLHRVE